MGCWREKKSASPIVLNDQINLTYTKVKTGDYTSGLLCIEVKSSKEDLWRTLTRDWDAFQDEGRRMQEWPHLFILIRPTRKQLHVKSRYAPKYSGAFVLERLEEWCQKYSVVPIFGFTDVDFHLIIRSFGSTAQQLLPPDHDYDK